MMVNDEATSDLQITVNELNPSIPATIIPLSSTTSKSSPPPIAPFTPSKNSSEKGEKWKPTLYEFPSVNAKKKHSSKYAQVELDLSGTNSSLWTKKAATKDVHAPIPDSETMIRAREVQSSLGNDHPSFLKTMVKSHVTVCFWMPARTSQIPSLPIILNRSWPLAAKADFCNTDENYDYRNNQKLTTYTHWSQGLPGRFCRSFLPKDDSMIVAEDENGHQCDLKFLAHKTGLSAGWRRFSVDHKLREGDVLIFQLVESCKFKIYIVRANVSKQVDGQLLNQDDQSEHITPDAMGRKPMNSSPSSRPFTTVKRKYTRSKPPALKGIKRKSPSSGSRPLTMVKRKYNRSKPQTPLSSLPIDHSMVNSELQQGSGSGSDSASDSLKPNLSSEELKKFSDFHIMVDKKCIDSELSEEIRMNYYKLCITKNKILHANIHEGLFYKLVAGMIGETVSIANALKNCKLTTRKEDFQIWDSSLKSFEFIGMKVGFLRDRIRELIILAFESEDAKRYAEAKEERNRNADMIMDLEGKIAELKESNGKLDEVICSLKEKAERSEIDFQEKVDAPW